MLIYDDHERCGDWAKSRIRHCEGWGDWYRAIGEQSKAGQLVAAVIYTRWTGTDILMNIASDGTHWLRRNSLRECFRYPFVQLGTRRVSAFVGASNVPSLRFVSHLGFQKEGLIRHGLPDEDLWLFGMLRSECKYL